MEQTIAALGRMTVTQLREKYLEVFGEPTRSGNKDFLFKRVAWRIQSLAEGGLSERARRRAEELARDADIRTTAPTAPGRRRRRGAHGRRGRVARPAHDRLPIPGTVLTRKYHGKQVAGEGPARRLRVRGPDLPLALRRRQGGHRLALERLPVLRPHHRKRGDAMSKRRHASQPRQPSVDPLRHLHPQEHRGGAGAGVQHASTPSARAARRTSPRQRHEGWVCLPDRYDDGGFTGGNIDRPALQRLLADIEAGKVDCVVVYKVDRLCRSPARLRPDDGGVREAQASRSSRSPSSSTPTHSMGRLMLNVLLSFAQFEREIISERTRDKIAAARRKGKWAGGKPLLGYDVAHPAGLEAGGQRGRGRTGSGRSSSCTWSTRRCSRWCRSWPTRGWTNKRWTTQGGRRAGRAAVRQGRRCTSC